MSLSSAKVRAPKKTSNTTPKSSRSTSVSKSERKRSVCVCPICDDEIVDDSSTQKGQDSIFCEGACSTWLHRGCAGLSKQLFFHYKTSDSSFYCTSCRLNSLSSEMETFRGLIGGLKEDLNLVKAELDRVKIQQSNSPPVSHSCPGPSPTAPSKHTNNPASPPNRNVTVESRHHSLAGDSENRKLNIIVFGIKECKLGLHYKQRFVSDLKNVSTLFNASDSKTPPSSIKDCRRLGKFSPNNDHPRPIMVRFNSCTVVMEILANRSFSAPYIIKPDLSPQERAREKILLKERWNLCQSGVNKSIIKIKGNSLMA